MNERNVFEAAIEIADPKLRRSFVESACAGDLELLARLLALLDSYDEMGTFLEISPVRHAEAVRPRRLAPSLADPEAATLMRESHADEVLAYLGPPTRPDTLGTLGHYQILSTLGRGGFGTVLKAFDESLHRLVAIKMLNPVLAATSPPRKRFLREARSGAAINHENIVQVHSIGEEPLPYLVMEYVDGTNLQEKMNREGPFELPEILKIGRQIAGGLAAAHATGLIHRDIKPGNILLDKGDELRVKITDFGLARAAADASLTQSGTIIGTPSYMSPEQASGGKVDPRSDLFSLGSVLYAMASGHPPFRASGTMAILRRVVEDVPRPLQDLIPELPDRLVAIVDRLLAKDPGQRFQTAREVADLLGQCLAELKTGAVVGSADESKPLAAPGPPEVKLRESAPTTPSTSSKSRRMRPVYALVLLLPILALAGLFPSLKKRSAVPSQSTPSTNAVKPSPTSTITPAPAPSPPTADPERALADWVLGQSGVEEFLVVPQGEPKTQAIKRAADLPKTPFVVTNVTLRDAAQMNDEDFARFGKVESLRGLVLSSSDLHLPEVTDKGLDHLLSPSVSKSFWYLELWSDLPNVTEAGYLALNKGHSLLTLYLQLPPGKGAFLARLKLRSLDHLGFIGDGIPAGAFEGLPSHMPDLRVLHLRGGRPSAAELQALSELDLLKILRLVDCGIDDDRLQALGQLTGLTEVTLDLNPEITDRGVVHLAKLQALELVGLDQAKVSDEACKTLASLPSLVEINLHQTLVKDSGLESLAALKKLRRLNLQNCRRITDKGLDALAKITTLMHLDILENPGLSEAALRKLKAALPRCQIASDYPSITAAFPRPIGSATQEREGRVDLSADGAD